MFSVSASIVVYGGAEEAITAVNSALEHAPEQFTLYLIDNASPDDSAARLKEAAAAWGERVQLVFLPENKGFGGGHNAVLGQLTSDVHFVLNPDVLIDSRVLGDMANWLQAHPDVVMATPQLYFPDGRVQNLPRRKPNFMGLLARQMAEDGPLQKFDRRYTMQDEDLTKPQSIQFCTGSFFAIKTDVYKKMGGFDESYFMYVEDADITQKALEYGRVYLLPQFRAVHAWHRNPSRDAHHFQLQLKSMFHYFAKWGFAFYS